MKRILIGGAVIVCMVSVMIGAGAPAYAHSGRGRGHHSSSHASQQTQHQACSIADCETRGLHEHDGVTYTCADHEAHQGYGRSCYQL